MRIYQVLYESKTGVKFRKFAGSADAASKLATQLKADGESSGRGEREELEVPTDKVGLISWLNENATAP